MDLMDFSGPFFRDLGDTFFFFFLKTKKKGGESWPAWALLPRERWTAEDSISVCIKRMRNFQLTKQGRTSQYGSERWLTSIPRGGKKKKSVVVKLLQTCSQAKLGDR